MCVESLDSYAMFMLSRSRLPDTVLFMERMVVGQDGHVIEWVKDRVEVISIGKFRAKANASSQNMTSRLV